MSATAPTGGLNPETDRDGHVEVDLGHDTDTDSSLGDDPSSSTYSASLTSSIRSYTYENGRRYHAFRATGGAEKYVLPNDEDEQDRLDLAHHIFRMVLGGALYSAPLESPQRILDIGTGTGLWAIEMADEFPAAEIVGTDISPIQPGWVPPNCKFYVEDAEIEPWSFEGEGLFHYVHGRAMAGSFGDWLKFYKQVYANLRPGGFLEMQEYAGRLFHNDTESRANAPFINDWNEECERASTMIGRKLDVAKEQKGWIEEAGFVDVTAKVVKIPLGKWAKSPTLKRTGPFQLAMMLAAVEPITNILYTQILQKSVEETATVMAGVRKEMVDSGRVRLYNEYWFIVGRKPG